MTEYQMPSDPLYVDVSTTDIPYSLHDDPLSPGDIMLQVQAGTVDAVRIRFNEEKATRLASALNQHYFMKWMAETEDESWTLPAQDTITEYRNGRDGIEYSIHPFMD